MRYPISIQDFKEKKSKQYITEHKKYVEHRIRLDCKFFESINSIFLDRRWLVKSLI